MLKNTHTRNIISAMLILNMVSGVIKAQLPNSRLFKKYCQTNVSTNKSSSLLLYTNNTFVNYGTYINRETSQFFVWYAIGTYSIENNTITCYSSNEPGSDSIMIPLVKHNYRESSDYFLYEKYYQYKKENYHMHTINMFDDKLIDTTKNIEYKNNPNF